MANLLRTGELASEIKEYIIGLNSGLAADGKESALAIIRVGENPSDIAYERSIEKYAESVSMNLQLIRVDEDIDEEEFLELLDETNEDEDIDGVLVFRPLPQHLDDDIPRDRLNPLKDVDGITAVSEAGVYDIGLGPEEAEGIEDIEEIGEIIPSWLDMGFPPCTAEACMLILRKYGIDPAGKTAVVIGRSNVIGKPVALMLMHKDATVTICHSKTQNLEEICRNADILVVATGKAESIGREYVSPGQTVLDVGIHVKEDGTMCGDVKFDEVEPVVANITPVPGGVGGLTTALLVKHAVDASMRFFIIENEDMLGDEYVVGQPLEESGMEIRGKVIKFDRSGDDDKE